MRELHAVVGLTDEPFPEGLLRRQMLLFDKFHIVDLDERLNHGWDGQSYLSASLDFLRSKDVVRDLRFDRDFLETHFSNNDLTLINGVMDNFANTSSSAADAEKAVALTDVNLRLFAGDLSQFGDHSVAICKAIPPEFLCLTALGVFARTQAGTVLRVASESLPVPEYTSSWQDILDFKADLHDKKWSFHRFLNTLATKTQSAAEIRDDIEWSINEYTKAMQVHHIKGSQSFIEVFIVSPLELVEDLVKLNFSKIARNVLSIGKRRVELLETEMKAPGRECAYVFDARQKFG